MLELTSSGGGKGFDDDVKVVIDAVCTDIAAARVLSRDRGSSIPRRLRNAIYRRR